MDASNIERNLYLTTQLLELGIPVVIALNMIDVIRKRGDTINIQELERVFGCPVFETSALLKEGSREAVAKAVELAKMQKEQKHLPSILKGLLNIPSPILKKSLKNWFLPIKSAGTLSNSLNVTPIFRKN